MSGALEQGVPFSMPPQQTLDQRMPDWQSVWTFLQIARSGSFRACAKQRGVTINSLRRAVESLEREVGFRILTRHVDGVRITPEGERILDVAKGMERVAIGLVRTRDALSDLDGAVRIAITEGLGAVWLAPRVAEYQIIHPRLRVDLACAMTSADILRMEADLAIQLMRPEAPNVRMVRLGYLHIMPYASRAYVAAHGLPTTIEQLATHRWALLVADQAATSDILRATFGSIPFTGSIAITSNTSSAHTLAIANGVGIGLLPTYTSALRTGLVPIDCGMRVRMDIWLTYHPDAEGVPRIRSAIRWMRASFDGRTFPFFAEGFVDPAQLPPMYDLVPLEDYLPDVTLSDGSLTTT